jgi:hypothetical protein
MVKILGVDADWKAGDVCKEQCSDTLYMVDSIAYPAHGSLPAGMHPSGCWYTIPSTDLDFCLAIYSIDNVIYQAKGEALRHFGKLGAHYEQARTREMMDSELAQDLYDAARSYLAASKRYEEHKKLKDTAMVESDQ